MYVRRRQRPCSLRPLGPWQQLITCKGSGKKFFFARNPSRQMFCYTFQCFFLGKKTQTIFICRFLDRMINKFR